MALKRFQRDGEREDATPQQGGVATQDRVAQPPRAAPASPGYGTAAPAAGFEAHLRQRERFGGFNWGAGFFGWLVAVGMATILVAVVAAAGAAIGLSADSAWANDAGTIGIAGGALLVGVLALAYLCGGYVAGRMSRFDGGRQGFGAWLIGLVVTVLIGAAGAVFGSQYNVLNQLHLPRIPIDEGSLATGGAIALGAIVLATLMASIIGGKLGQRYHLRVDRAGLPPM